MLTAIGDLLNWAVAGIVFPLMFLPLAAFAPGRRPLAGTAVFALMALAAAASGALFATLAPRLGVEDIEMRGGVFAGALAALAVLVALLGGPRKAAALLAATFETIARGAGRLVMWLTLAMALVQFGIVILRYVFGINSIFMQESVTYMHGAVFLLAAGYALLTDDHVRVDIFYRTASPRRKAMVNLAGAYVFLFPAVLVALWTSSEYVGHSWSVREGSAEQSGIAGVYLLKSLIPAFAILLAMAGFAAATRAGQTLRGER
ncbi:MAG: TRAP transporter small permease subunit [Parvularculaceae bacterium]|nr:TRAP transporter small permease subunit [Parvularculaceae bacterium]